MTNSLSPPTRQWTERSSATKALLSNSESMFQQWFERSADAVLLLDPEAMVFLDCNDAAVGLMHAGSKGALLQARPTELLPPSQPDGKPSSLRLAEEIEEVTRSGSQRFEWMVRRCDGVDVPAIVLATLIEDQGRRLFVIVARDISKRKRAEAELRASQELLASVADKLSEAIYRTGPDHELIFANNAYLRMSGYESMEAMKHMPREKLYANPADRARLLELLRRDGAFRNQEIEYVRRDGHRWWGLTNSVAIHDPATGSVLYHVGSVADITERKQAEEAWRESEARFRRMFEESADGISLLDVQTGRFLDVNRATARMLGHKDPRELVGTTPEQDSPEFQPDGRRSAEKAAEMIGRAMKEGSVRFEWEGRRADGAAMPLEISLTPLETGERPVLLVVSRDITERKRAEAELRQLTETLERRILERTSELSASEARLRTLVDHAPEAIVVFDGETGRFISGNLHACRIYGFCLDDLCNHSPADVSPETQACGRRSVDLAREKIDEALGGGTPVFDWIHRHSSGRLIPTEVRLVRLPSEGRPLVRASIIDNTERRRSELVQQATFQISEAAHTAGDLHELYRQIHEIVKTLMPAENLYIALADSDGGTFSFPYFVDEKDTRPAPMGLDRGLTGFVIRTGRTLLAAENNIRRSGDGRGVVVEPGGESVYIEVGAQAAVWLGAPLTIDGQTIGVVAVQNYQDAQAYGEEEKRILSFVACQIARAIERKRAEQALRDSEEKFRALFEASSLGVMLHDDEQYLDVNSAAVRILGYASREDLIGKHPRDTSPPTQPGGGSSDALARKHIQACMEHGSTRFEWVARHANGHDVPLEVILTRIEWGGRQIIQAAITDISERKQAESELLKSLAREKELGQLKSNFVSMVSHEFRTPLGVIMSSAEILESYFEQLEPADRREQLASIRKNTRRMANLMEEVLVLGMVEAGKMDFRPAPLALPALCRRLVDELDSAMNRKCPVQMNFGLHTDEAFADERLLRHIFTNLLSNAVKYSKEGSPVHLQIARDGNEAICHVRDQGVGIPEADLDRMFTAFHRGRNAANISGTGLGLTIVKRCVELHGGSIKIESVVAVGTTVTVRLPLFQNVVGAELSQGRL